MNFGTLIGIILGAAVLVGAAIAMSADPAILWNPVGLLVVLGGTAAATFVSFRMDDVLRALKGFVIIFREDDLAPKRNISDMLKVARIWAKGDVRGASGLIRTMPNPFLRLGLELAIDSTTPLDDIVQTLRWRIEKLRNREDADAAIFRAMASYAPAFGMLGTLLGLIEMLRMVGDGPGLDFSELTGAMAVALMTTLYGLLLANLVFRPIATKLDRRTRLRVAEMNLIVASIVVMRTKRSMGVVRETLENFVTEQADELSDRHAERPDPVTP
ncbi:MotA/TolQ/ExbB proton channel family protein [Fodinicurvata sp. EGI_FJ10296]|uniref:motility protein A n=1 Tax=Fodinicurvata sp. EGI_FJ10296 TaxID=3231908 RepID=UPI003455F390